MLRSTRRARLEARTTAVQPFMAILSQARTAGHMAGMDAGVRRYEGSYDNPFTKQDWLDYYSRKRIVHQWTQVHLLGTVDCEKILEVGPALGLVSSMLVNIGYEVHTLDVGPRAFY